MSNPQRQRLIAIVEPVCEAAGFELVDLRFLVDQGGWVLRVQIDVPVADVADLGQVPEDRVDLTDCEELSRELSAVLDVDDPIAQAYSLEVGSPGVDRPLRTAKHFARFAGSEAKIQLYAPLVLGSGERRNFRGVLRGLDETGTKTLIDVDGQSFALVIEDIDHAKLVPDWDEVMKGRSGLGPKPAAPAKPGHRPSHKPKKPHSSSAAAGGASTPSGADRSGGDSSGAKGAGGNE